MNQHEIVIAKATTRIARMFSQGTVPDLLFTQTTYHYCNSRPISCGIVFPNMIVDPTLSLTEKAGMRWLGSIYVKEEGLEKLINSILKAFLASPPAMYGLRAH